MWDISAFQYNAPFLNPNIFHNDRALGFQQKKDGVFLTHL